MKLYITILLLFVSLLAFPQSMHIVKSGEDMQSVCDKYGVTEQALSSANNGIKSLSAGMMIKIPAAKSRRIDETNSSSKKDVKKTTAKKETVSPKMIKGVEYQIHKVTSGETLSAIARKYNVKISEIVGAGNVLQIGQKLSIPTSKNKQPAEAVDAKVKTKVEPVIKQTEPLQVQLVSKVEALPQLDSLISLIETYNASLQELNKNVKKNNEVIEIERDSVFEMLQTIQQEQQQIIKDLDTPSEEPKVKDDVLNENYDGASFSASADVMSRYVWRGTDFGGSPSIQPGVEISGQYWSIGAWGAYTLNGNQAQEADLYLSFSPNDIISFTVTDYFFPTDGDFNNYFDISGKQTCHLVETSMQISKSKKAPFSLLIGVNVLGADAKRSNGKNFYSTYAEINYETNINKTDVSVFMGWNLVPSGFYGDNVGVVNLGVTASKEIKITNKYALPLVCSLITNPQAENIHIVFGISF